MATLTELYRSQTLAVRANFIQDLLDLWPLIDFNDVTGTLGPLTPSLAALVRRDRQRVTGLTSTYLKAEKLAQGFTTEAVVQPAQPLVERQFVSTLLATTVAGYYTALRTRTPEAAAATALVETIGGLGRLVLNAGRETTIDSLNADPDATGWYRVTAPGACDFCRMLEGRGAKYSAENVRFSAHDHCACSARPEYGGLADTVPVLPYERSRHGDRSTPARRARNNAAARAWIAEHM